MGKAWALIILILMGAPSAQAKSFQNSYIKFELPSRWTCTLRKKAYLCRYKVAKSCKKNPNKKICKDQINKSREAVIVLSAKEKSNIDSIESYKNFLGESKNMKLKNGASSQSQIIHNKLVSIDGGRWVDSMHLSSELPHYYTRYLATIKGEVAVLVTFTSHKKYYTNYSTEFFKSIKTIKLTASSLSQVPERERGKPVFSKPIDIPDEMFEGMAPPQSSENDDGFSTILFGLAMLLAAIGIYIWVKRKK